MLKSPIQTSGQISANPVDSDTDPDPDLPDPPAHLCGLRVQPLWERRPIHPEPSV